MYDPRRKEALKQKEALQALLNSPGWTILAGAIREQYELRLDKLVLEPLEDGNAVFRQEFLKGEMATLRLLPGLAQSMVDAAQMVIDVTSEEKDERDPDADDSSDDE